jgi:hypothetical protein
MRYLDTDNGANSTAGTKTTAKGTIPSYTIDVSEAWNSQYVEIDSSINSLNFQIVEDNTISGSGTMKLQFSVDGVNFTDVTGASYSVGASMNEAVIYSTDSSGYLRFNNDGSASSGDVTIIVRER